MNLAKVVASIAIIVLITILVYLSKDSIKQDVDILSQISQPVGLADDEVLSAAETDESEENVISQDEPTSIPSLWQTSENQHNPPILRSDIDDAVLVSYERAVINQLAIGSIVEIYIPQLDQSINILVTHSDLLASGNVSFRGHLESNSLFSFVMTLGETSMFATIGTPDGIFNVSGNQDSAWVIPAASLKKQMNTEMLDYRSIPENKNPPPTGNG